MAPFKPILSEANEVTGGRAPAFPRHRPSVRLRDIPEQDLTPQVKTVLDTLVEEVNRLRDDLEQSRRRMEELENIADEDPLVGVLNRRAFHRELSRALAHCQRYGVTASLLFFDLDGFKQVNDRFGHAAGDKVLREVGAVLRRNVRDSDLVGRLGGDEFAVVLLYAGEEVSANKAERLCEELAATPIVVGGDRVSVGSSVGVTAFRPGDTADAVLARADKNMYVRKASRVSSGPRR